MVSTDFQKKIKHSTEAPWELLTFRKPKFVFQNKNNAHENPNNSHNYHDEIELYQGISKRNRKGHSTPKQRAPQKNLI